MAYNDSVDKIVTYFEAVTNHPFIYKKKTYEPKPLMMSPMILRGFKCPSGCGACCNFAHFTLDYLPTEVKPYELPPRTIHFDGREVVVWSEMQRDNSARGCMHLSQADGRCQIHMKHAFSCDFELIKFMKRPTHGSNLAIHKLFGRGWSMPRIDGGRGAMCSMEPASKESIDDAVRKLTRLKEWTDYFGLKDTKVPTAIQWIEAQRLVPFDKVKAFLIDNSNHIDVIEFEEDLI